MRDLKAKKNPKGGWSGSDGDEATKVPGRNYLNPQPLPP